MESALVDVNVCDAGKPKGRPMVRSSYARAKGPKFKLPVIRAHLEIDLSQLYTYTLI